MTAEDPAIALARMDGRLLGIEGQLKDIKTTMATREGSSNLLESIGRLETALSDERLARLDGDKESKADNDKTAARLQLVEDRQEARKFQFGIAIALAILGPIITIVIQNAGMVS